MYLCSFRCHVVKVIYGHEYWWKQVEIVNGSGERSVSSVVASEGRARGPQSPWEDAGHSSTYREAVEKGPLISYLRLY